MEARLIQLPSQAIAPAKRFEGFYRVPKNDPGRAHPYICPAGYHTIGTVICAKQSTRRSCWTKPKPICHRTSPPQ
jgi:GH24 family phage-related lysozyme (muramidase)